MQPGDIVYIQKVEQYWNKPYVMKRHHVYDTRSVILKCKVIEIRGNEFRALLLENNGFEKDGQEFVFNKHEMLCNQDFTDVERLGVWNE